MKKNQKGFSLIELLIVVAIILIIAAIAIPNLLRSRMAANEASAVGSLRTINTACVTFQTTYPSVGFPATLAALGTSGAASSTAADLSTAFWRQAPRAATRSRIRFLLAARLRPGTRYANALSQGTSGTRGFYSDQSGVIRSKSLNGATSADFLFNRTDV